MMTTSVNKGPPFLLLGPSLYCTPTYVLGLEKRGLFSLLPSSLPLFSLKRRRVGWKMDFLAGGDGWKWKEVTGIVATYSLSHGMQHGNVGYNTGF